MARSRILTLVSLALCGGVALFDAAAQSPQPSPAVAQPTAQPAAGSERVRGEVVSVDKSARRLVVKTADGKKYTVSLSDKTAFNRMPPGETSLKNAVVITLADVSVGDRVVARGVVADDAMAANLLLVIAGADIAQVRAREQAEWERRGVAGRVTALNPQAKEITLRPALTGAAPIVVAAGGKDVSFRRFTPEAVRFTDTKESKFEELKVGDHLRVLGERSADASRLTAEKVVSGAFYIVGGSVTKVNADKGELILNDIQTKQPVTVAVRADSVMRRLPPELLKALEGGKGGAPADVQRQIEALPMLKLADLKAGDGVLVLSAKGASPSRATAIMLAAGVEDYLKRQASQATRPGFTLDLALPGLP
ncbi:MAG TPA: hypothetical protein VEZ40_13805 [Pyrinomonadaceae bacterium]|nr:hypothetical protein [Pyrinomonadaceae bacterium]